ncbi:MFS transporter [Actinocorallia herbida]|uniref:MFS transporter n=1 Tax=Actinocorallia herbida TaxID=58109 RepID=A0A3N1D162_9ACTN|nr:MFS transporter [Actinocorallia herbida]ROO87273.1 MFS transporter [Actinocorallia herbida]
MNAPAPKARPFLAVLLTMMLIEGAGIFEQSMVLGGIPFFAEHFQADLVAVSWIITIFVLVGAVSAVVAGRLGDLYGRRRVLVVLLTLSLLGSVVSIVFGTLPALIAGRALQGTSAGIIPLLIGIARETMPEKRVPVVVSIITATATLSGGLGMLVAGIFIDAGQWRLMFAAAGGLALLALLACVLTLPNSPGSADGSGRVDWVGAALLTPALSLVLYGLTSANGKGFGSSAVLATAGIGAVLLAVWVWWELRTSDPIVDLRLMIDAKISRTMLVVVFSGLGLLSVSSIISPLAAQLPADLPVGAGLSATQFGGISMLGAVIGFALSPLAGKFAARHGGALLSIIAGGIALVAILLLLRSPLNKEVPVVGTAIVLMGVAAAFLLAAIYNMLVESVPAENTGAFIGTAQVVRNLLMAVGTAAASSLISSDVVPGTTAPTAGAWALTLGYLIAVIVIAIGVAFTVFRRSAAVAAPAPLAVREA